MSHGCAASFGLLISVNSNRTNYKILCAESNKRNENFLNRFAPIVWDISLGRVP